MATTLLNVTFDGVNDVARLTGQPDVEWFGSNPARMDIYSVYHSVTGDDLEATANFTGSDWTIRYFRIAGDDHLTTINDLNAQADRRVEHMVLGFDSDVNLISTRVDYIIGWDGAMHDVSLGSADTVSVTLDATQNIVTTGDGYVGIIRTGGTDTITIGDGDAGTVETGDGNDTIIVADSRINYLNSGAGNDTVTVSGNGRINAMEDFGGTNTINISGTARISSLFAGSSNNTITLTEDARIFQLKVDNGVNTITTEDGFFESMTSYNASNTINIGDGGAGQLFLSANSSQTQTITATGKIQSLQVFGDQETVVNLGAGGAGTIRLGDGNDRVTTTTGWVELISMGDGRDTVNMGSGGGGLVQLGSGNDTIRLTELDTITEGLVIKGGTGTDTVSFISFSTGVIFTLDSAGIFQNVGHPTGDVNVPSVGYFSEVSVDNIVGTNQTDTLTGDLNDNLLMGLGAADTLDGGAGDDTLNGGTGADVILGGDGEDSLVGGGGQDSLNGGADNDLLRGGAGKDTFVFGDNSGTDSVQAYVRSADTLQIEDHTGGFAALTIADSGADRSITYDGGEILLLGRAGLNLNASDFDFV